MASSGNVSSASTAVSGSGAPRGELEVPATTARPSNSAAHEMVQAASQQLPPTRHAPGRPPSPSNAPWDNPASHTVMPLPGMPTHSSAAPLKLLLLCPGHLWPSAPRIQCPSPRKRVVKGGMRAREAAHQEAFTWTGEVVGSDATAPASAAAVAMCGGLAAAEAAAAHVRARAWGTEAVGCGLGVATAMAARVSARGLGWGTEAWGWVHGDVGALGREGWRPVGRDCS